MLQKSGNSSNDKYYRKKLRVISIVLIVGSVLMLFKFAAFFLTNSNAILTDALESIINISTSLFALFVVFVSSKPKDEDHPYGHGKIEFFGAGLEGALITITGIGMIGKAIYAFFHPIELQNIDIGIAITASAGLVNFFLGNLLIRKGKNYNSLIMIADGKHLITDTLSSLGLVGGLIIIWLTGVFWLDSVLTIILGIVILYSGFKLLRNAFGGLMDEADVDLLNTISTTLEKHRRDKWIDIHNLRILRFGPYLHVDCHITMPYYDDLKTIHEEIDLMEKLVNDEMPENIEFFVHAEPCSELSCPVCQIESCPVRKHPFIEKVSWSADTLVQKNKHSLTKARHDMFDDKKGA